MTIRVCNTHANPGTHCPLWLLRKTNVWSCRFQLWHHQLLRNASPWNLGGLDSIEFYCSCWLVFLGWVMTYTRRTYTCLRILETCKPLRCWTHELGGNWSQCYLPILAWGRSRIHLRCRPCAWCFPWPGGLWVANRDSRARHWLNLLAGLIWFLLLIYFQSWSWVFLGLGVIDLPHLQLPVHRFGLHRGLPIPALALPRFWLISCWLGLSWVGGYLDSKWSLMRLANNLSEV